MRTIIRSLLLTLSALVVLSAPGFSAVKLMHSVSVYSDDQQKGLKQPEGVACGKEALFIVADTGNGRLVRYTYQSGALQAAPDIKIPQLTYPIRVQIDGSGNIFALDEKQRRIVRLSAEGEFKEYVEVEGAPGSKGIVPRSFFIAADGSMYILDIGAGRVIVLDAAGKYVRSIPFPEHHGFLSDVTVDFKGTILLIDSIESVVFAAPANAKTFTPLTKSMKENVSFPTSITTDKRGTIYVVDQNGGDVIIVGQDGTFQGRLLSMGWKEGLLRYPSQCCINAEGDLFIADRGNNRVQIFRTIE